MSELDELIAAVSSAFEVTAKSLPAWPDPHGDRSPDGEEYSRLTNPGRWRIVVARAEAWLVAIERKGLAVIERGVTVNWEATPGTMISRVDRAVPEAHDALALVIARNSLGEVADAGVTVGVGDPAVGMAWLPDCGCDACDMGSQYELDQLDEYVLAVVTGAFRHLRSGDRTIQVIGDGGWEASGLRRRENVEAVLADPTGWNELAGASWLQDR